MQGQRRWGELGETIVVKNGGLYLMCKVFGFHVFNFLRQGFVVGFIVSGFPHCQGLCCVILLQMIRMLMMMINPRTQKAVFSQIVVFHFISFIFLSEIEDMICSKHVISTDQWSLSPKRLAFSFFILLCSFVEVSFKFYLKKPNISCCRKGKKYQS